VGILSIFKRKEHTGHDLDDDDRQTSLELRRKNASLKAIEQERRNTLAQIQLETAQYELQRLREDMQDDAEEEEPQDAMSALMPVILAKFLGGGVQNPQQQTAVTPSATDCKVELTDNQISDILSKIPNKQKKILLSMQDDSIRAIAKSYLGNLSEGSTDRCLKALRNAQDSP